MKRSGVWRRMGSGDVSSVERVVALVAGAGLVARGDGAGFVILRVGGRAMAAVDEHMTLSVAWRVQLQDVEQALEIGELIGAVKIERIRRADLVDEISALLDDAVIDE